jgi:hypothetical protein
MTDVLCRVLYAVLWAFVLPILAIMAAWYGNVIVATVLALLAFVMALQDVSTGGRHE